MLDTYHRMSFILIMAMSVVGIIGFIPLLFIQHIIYKRIFDPIYFNTKHYSAYELEIFKTFPLFFVKTIGYIKAIVFPNTMRRKFKESILKPGDNPIVYTLALITIIILIISAIIILNTVVAGVLLYFNE